MGFVEGGRILVWQDWKDYNVNYNRNRLFSCIAFHLEVFSRGRGY